MLSTRFSVSRLLFARRIWTSFSDVSLQSPPIKMFSVLLIVASFVLPSVLGGCCFPDKMKSTTFIAGNKQGSLLLVDFTQNKFISRPQNDSEVEFVLGDFANQMQYTKFKDGNCVKEHSDVSFNKCIPSTATELGQVKLGDAMVDAYSVQVNAKEAITILVTSSCHPAVMVESNDGKVDTTFYVNVSSGFTNVSDLDQDISGCVDAA